MCSCCQGGKDICDYSTPSSRNAMFISNGNKLYCQIWTSYIYQEINYCPMCGRKLEAE